MLQCMGQTRAESTQPEDCDALSISHGSVLTPRMGLRHNTRERYAYVSVAGLFETKIYKSDERGTSYALIIFTGRMEGRSDASLTIPSLLDPQLRVPRAESRLRGCARPSDRSM